MSDCVCGHSRTHHDFHEGCIRFLCCDRTRNLSPGYRHTEHDGIKHKVTSCRCRQFQTQPTTWQEDMEAGAIG